MDARRRAIDETRTRETLALISVRGSRPARDATPGKGRVVGVRTQCETMRPPESGQPVNRRRRPRPDACADPPRPQRPWPYSEHQTPVARGNNRADPVNKTQTKRIRPGDGAAAAPNVFPRELPVIAIAMDAEQSPLAFNFLFKPGLRSPELFPNLHFATPVMQISSKRGEILFTSFPLASLR